MQISQYARHVSKNKLLIWKYIKINQKKNIAKFTFKYSYKDPSKLKYVCEIDEILPTKLYLGNYEAANNKDLLKQKQITHILVCGEFLKCRFPGEFEYKVIPIQDSLKQGILEFLEESFDFIENGKSVFVHCAAGINRSPAIVCGYLMKKMKWNYDQAFEFVKERRVKANRQSNFAEQLQKYEY